MKYKSVGAASLFDHYLTGSKTVRRTEALRQLHQLPSDAENNWPGLKRRCNAKDSLCHKLLCQPRFVAQGQTLPVDTLEACGPSDINRSYERHWSKVLGVA